MWKAKSTRGLGQFIAFSCLCNSCHLKQYVYINFKCICTSYKTLSNHYKRGCLGGTAYRYCAWSCPLNGLNWESILAVGNKNKLHWKSLAQCFWESCCQYSSFPSITQKHFLNNKQLTKSQYSALKGSMAMVQDLSLCESVHPATEQTPTAPEPFSSVSFPHVTETPHRNHCDTFMPHLLIFLLKKAQRIVSFKKHTHPKHKP